ncbi:hypothetical protein SE15_13085 [Thermanaerothrix daxensis]|uniref:Sec-independent protein translocase protein TatA n=1 Tax=Thermanaerothrix daxensis TaxID=869279 RepID=A0A0P6YA68_9CHLR|nr:twin-arginine translocase TatA/TatE family subunit [Thermanaerothrix daxensis]KPL82049.1 hypothetical protein SE15_13085 [Thermanaerothrix daxensis]
MWRPGLPELLIVLVLILLLFGPGRITKIAGELGSGIRAFREGLEKKESPEAPADKKDETTPPSQ